MAGQNTTSLTVKDVAGEDVIAEWHKHVQPMSKAVSLGQQVPAQPKIEHHDIRSCLLYTSPSPRDSTSS
eukprot:12903987-Prorocentrum_lima.AAC.1